jgi:hypothetical protein
MADDNKNNPDRIDLPDEETRILEGGITCHVKRIGRPSAKVMRECMERVAPWLEEQKARGITTDNKKGDQKERQSEVA